MHIVKIHVINDIDSEPNDIVNDIRTVPKVVRCIGFMSIDTEGSEMDVLEGLNLNRRCVSLIAIEHNHRPGRIAEIEAPAGRWKTASRLLVQGVVVLRLAAIGSDLGDQEALSGRHGHPRVVMTRL